LLLRKKLYGIEAMTYAYLSGHHALAEVGKWFGVSYATGDCPAKKRDGYLFSQRRGVR
jgi:hypothetical protein